MAVQNETRSPGSIVYFLAGGLIGAATALLFAPKAGADLRHDIADVTRKGYDGALDLTHRVKDQAATFYDTVKERGSDLVDTATQTLASGRKALDQAVDKGEDVANNVLSLGEQATGGSRTTRKSTDVV